MGAGRWIFLWVVVLWSFRAAAQQAPPLQQKIQVTGGAHTINDIAEIVYRQTGLRFSFNAAQISAGRRITFPQKHYTLGALLDFVGGRTGATYVIYNEHIIFRTAPQRTAPAAHPPGAGKTAQVLRTNHPASSTKRPTGEITPVRAAAGTHPSSAGENDPPGAESTGWKAAREPGKPRQPPAAQPATSSPIASSTSSSLSQTTGGKTVAASAPPSSSGTGAGGKAPAPYQAPASSAVMRGETSPVQPGKAVPATDEIRDIRPVYTERVPVTVISPASLPPQRPSLAYRSTPRRGNTALFLAAGLWSDDALYLQPAIMAGLPAIHAIAGWGTNFQASGFRYGLGSVIDLQNEWRLHIQATTGRLTGRTVPLDTTRDLAARSQLHRISLLMEKQLNSRWTVAAGPVFNYLSTAYFLNGQRQSLFSMGLADHYNDRNLYTVKPWYTITNTFDATAVTHVKTWVGLQVSVYYRINF